METKSVNSMNEFLAEFTNQDLIGGTLIFRGQAQKGNLLPGIARLNRLNNTTETERKMLNELRLRGQMRLSGAPKSSLDLLILAQHYGMKTRLLDWTSNPLAALWFACADRNSGDVYVYVIDASKHMVVLDENFDPFAQNKTLVVRPSLSNDRILAQHGWFTLHRFSKSGHGGFFPLEKMQGGDLQVAYEYHIPGNARDSIISDLDRCGINRATLMPDLGGLCQHLNFLHNFS